jgi:hypothetical protein
MKIGTFHTPPRNQGQIVEISYTQIDGRVIRKVFDQSDRTTEYAVADALDDDEGDYWNDEPGNSDWKPISAQELNRLFAADWDVEF